MRERGRHKPPLCNVLVAGNEKLLEPYLKSIEAAGFSVSRDAIPSSSRGKIPSLPRGAIPSSSRDGDAELIVAFDISEDELTDLRRNPATRFVPVLLISKRTDTWPEGADIVITLPASPQFVAAQVQALRRRILIERSVSPLTGLPGALSTEIEMESRFSSGGLFYASYIDINNFKPFNDAYGFEKGDLVIKALSGLVKDSLSRFHAGESFCGHVGGDDFVVLTSGDPEFAMRWLAFELDRQIRGFYTETDLSRGGIVSFDREGRRKRFPLMSISIVSLCCGKGVKSKGEISYELARFKRKAKHEAMCTEGSVFLPSKGDEEATGAEWVLPNLIQGHSVPASSRRAAMEAAGELRLKETVDCLRFVLKKSPDDKLRKSAAYSLGRMSDRNSMGELLTALKDTSAHVRMRAAEALGEMGDGRALEPLLNATSDVSRHVRCAALVSIGRLGIKSAMPSLVKAASDRSVEVRISAVNAIGALGEPGAYPVLIACIRERQPALTRAAAEAMGYIPDVRCLDVLCSLLESTDQGCVWRAAYSIYLLTKSGLIPIDGGLVATLIQRAMRSKDGHVLRACALALGAIGEQNAVGPLIALLRDPRDYVRSAAAVALGRIGDRRALRPLRLAMRDGRPMVRVKAAWALGELSCPEAVESLRLSLKDKVESVREMAAVSIFRLLERIALDT